MFNENIVVFKGTRNGITIILDDKPDFSILKESLRLKVIDAKKFFGGAKASITFQGRTLSEPEENELLAIIAKEANLNISFVNNKVMLIPPEPPPEAIEHRGYTPQHMATFHKGSLRSGQSIKYSGSVIVLGDCNPGSELIAEGNVIVLGSLKGLVHAGCTGNSECYVSALLLTPVQLRIADILTFIPDEIIKKNKKKPIPSYAYISEGQIYIAPLQ